MPPLLFAGADYSAARSEPNPTWLAVATLTKEAGAQNGGIFKIESLENCGSSGLLTAISAARDFWGRDFDAIGLDFPFSYPAPFIKALATSRAKDSNLSRHGDTCVDDKGQIDWIKAISMVAQSDYSLIETLADSVTAALGSEPARLADRRSSPKGTSPLHRLNPGLRKMTWQGAALLCELRAMGYSILPFEGDYVKTGAVMEVYPASMLRSLELPHRKYKGPDASARQIRLDILDTLTRLHTVKWPAWMDLELVIEPSLQERALLSDDALDAIIAALAATIAHLNSALCGPSVLAKSASDGHTGSPVDLDGWIYTPYLQNSEL